jgi:hypothetical protein
MKRSELALAGGRRAKSPFHGPFRIARVPALGQIP